MHGHPSGKDRLVTMRDQDDLRALIADVLDAMRRGDEELTRDRLNRLAEAGLPQLRAANWELASANAGMLRALADPLHEDVPVTLELCGADGDAIDIDESDPALRAALRTLLALANHHPADAQLQLDIVAAQEVDEMALTFLHTAGWTLRLLDLLVPVQRTGGAVPGWLRHLSTKY